MSPSLHGLLLESMGASKNTLEANLLVRANLPVAFLFGTLREMNSQQHPLDMFLEQAALQATATNLALAILALAEDISLS